MPKWTYEQLKAIETTGQNIIVSAGAGSGKTAVLSERILHLVKQGYSVKNIIVLTFTNAAALEMKTRIYNKLVNNKLLEEASLVHTSPITTFDAFSLSLVKRYYYLLDVSKDIKICDEDIISLKLDEIIENIFQRYYYEEYKPFLNFIKHQGLKNDHKLFDLFKSLHKRLSLVPDTKKYLDNYILNYFNDSYLDQLIVDFQNIVLNELNLIIDDFKVILKLVENDDEYLKFYEGLNDLVNMLLEIDDYDKFINITINYPRLLKAYPELKDKYENAKEKLKRFKNFYYFGYNSKELLKKQLLLTKSDTNIIIDICKEIEEEIFNYKKIINSFTFNDIAKMAIKLVTEFSEVKEYFNNINEILVDEYQDTSDLQETFLAAIEKNNLYMVGDIKQSIYRFRNSNPYIFKNKYDNFSKNIGGVKIDLLKNFRSRKETLFDINLIFKHLMTNTYGDADYIKDHQMNFGLSLYNDLEKGNYHLENIIYEDINLLNIDEDNQNHLDIKKRIAKHNKNALVIAIKIKELMKREVFDKDTNTLRKAKYSDIAIILDKKVTFEDYVAALNEFNIPSEILGEINVNDNIITLTLLNLLSLYNCYLNNDLTTEYKLSLTGLYRSFLYNYTDEDILKIFNKEKEDDILTKLNRISKDISPYDTLVELLNEFNFYNKLPLVANTYRSLKVIDYFCNKLTGATNLGLDFSKTVSFLIDAFNKNKEMSILLDKEENDAVKIMTVHKSKGLEYPFCIFSELNSIFNMSDIKNNYTVSDKYGILIPSINEKGKSCKTVLHKLNTNKIKMETISEKIRLFYVALTRAREQIIFVRDKNSIIKKNKDEVIDKVVKDINEVNSFNDFLLYLDNFGDYILKNKNTYLEDLNILEIDINEFKNDLSEYNERKIDLIYDNISFESDKIVKMNISHRVDKLLDKNEQYIINEGLTLHNILENINLKNVDYNLIPTKYQQKIQNILNIDLFKDINEAKIYQELEFYYEYNNESFNGIIDLIIEHNDFIYLIDYKLSDINKEYYYDQLKVYYNYLKLITNKDIKVYLLSLYNLEYKELFYEEIN